MNLMLRIVCITHGSVTMAAAGVAVTTQRLSVVFKKLPHKSKIYRCFHIDQPSPMNYPAVRIIKPIHYLNNDYRLLNNSPSQMYTSYFIPIKLDPWCRCLVFYQLAMYLYIASHGELISVSSQLLASLLCYWMYLQYYYYYTII